MATYLLTWNPDRWPKKSDDIRAMERLIAATKAGEQPLMDWNSGRNGQVQVGNRIFLVGLNTLRGIVGSGVVVECRGKQPHFDMPDKEAYEVVVQWDTVVGADDVLPMDEAEWAALGVRLPLLESGRRVPDQSVVALEQLWNHHRQKFGRTTELLSQGDAAFAVPMLFLRIGWMRFYEGQSDDDHIHGGGAFVREHGYGHEMFNFLPYDGQYYGYVRPTSGGSADSNFVDGAGIKLERIVPTAKKNSAIEHVLVVWVSSPPEGGAFIVGWYRNATVFREHQPPPTNSNRMHKGEAFGYYVHAHAADVTRLEPTARVFPVPSHQKGGIGQSNVWYADDPEQHKEFRQSVLEYIAGGELPKAGKSSVRGSGRQPDPLLRCKIERAAVDAVTAFFEGQGYIVDSVENDNVGWDLLATCGMRELRLEVKGLSGGQLCVELTPNEYAQMQRWKESYCVCVVTNAITEPNLAVFAFSPESGRWQDDRKRTLRITQIVAARCSLD